MKWLILCMLLLLPSMAEATTSASCENKAGQLDVQNAIDATSAGGTVTVPAGTCIWTTRVLINAKALTLTGATVCSGSPVSCTDNTNITDNVSTGTCIDGVAALCVGGLSATNFVSVSGFTFIKSAAHSAGIVQMGTSLASSFQVSFRFHHNHILQASGGARGMSVSGAYGLIDHNFFEVTATCSPLPCTQASIQSIRVIGSSASTDGGHTPWRQPLTLGTDKAVYVEDNTITYGTSGTPGDDALDAYGGARFVVRYNRINNDGMGHHGTDSGNQRSPVSFEVYNNTFTNTGPSAKRGWTIRGATGVLFNNTYSGSASWSAVTIQYYRACSDDAFTWQACDGTNWEMNSATLSSGKSRICTAINGGSTGATTNNAGYAAGTTTITLAAAGTGNITAGDQINFGTSSVNHTVSVGDADVSNGGTITFGPALTTDVIPAVNTAIVNGGFRFDATTNEILGAEGATFTKYMDNGGAAESGSFGYPCRDQPGRGPGQVLEPIYYWNNAGGSVDPGIGANDAWTNNCQGHGLANYLLSGRDWINNGVTAKPGYTAYTYPHPLQGEAPPPPVPDTPQNLRIVGSTNAHAVTLTWPASTDATTVGYYVLMGTTTGVYNFTPVATRTSALAVSTHSPLTQTIITNLPAGTYYFTVVGYSADFTRSDPATEVSATFTALARDTATARGAR